MPESDGPDQPLDQRPDGLQPDAGAQPRVVDVDIEAELQDSYLTYAMSTIMDRALPDVRDGLKPSQRRILVAMNDLNLRPNRKHIKCAKICGDTSGNYHPHGESVIYPTLVGMAQPWRMAEPLVDSQGNFGSIDGDPPAAMRYTEARLTAAAMDMLADLQLSTVDFQPNYDERIDEPTVLPGRFPNLLVNGSVGIAVGMATSLAPHNPAEILDAIVRVVRDPSITLDRLMQDDRTDDATLGDGGVLRGVKGPDFPTGGAILGRRGIVDAYATGRGKVTIRGLCHTEDIGKDRAQLVIDEIPYMLNQSTLVERIVDAVKEDRIKDIADVRNESGREARSRIVIELKRGADPAVVENQLYQFTPLQQTFSIHNIALVNRRPRTLGLRELIDCYVGHRMDVIRRRTAHLLREARREGHRLEGLLFAVFDIDEVIRLIRTSATREQAIERLMAKRFRIPASHPSAAIVPPRLLELSAQAEGDGGVALTRFQAEHIGQMRLIQLVGLEVEKLSGQYAEVLARIAQFESILASEALVRDLIVADCKEMRARYSRDRLTRIDEAEGDITIESLIPQGEVAVTISHHGYAKRVPLETYRQQGRGGKGVIASDFKDDDFIEHLFIAGTHDDLLCFTDTGRVFKMKVYELPELSRTSKGRPIVNLIDLREGEKVRAFLAIRDFERTGAFLLFASREGIVKRTALKEYRNVNRAGLIAVGLKEGDAILDVAMTGGNDDVMLVAASGIAIRFSEDDVRLMGRPAAGVKGVELGEGDEVVGLVVVPMQPDAEGDPATAQAEIDANLCLLTITEQGYGKRTTVDEYRVQPESGKPRSQSRGGKGRADIKSSERNGRSVAALAVHESDDVVVITRQGQLVRLPAASISQLGRGTQGVRVVKLNEGDAVIAAALIRQDAAEGA